MTDDQPLEQSPAHPPVDRWSLWFGRLVQICGLALILYEALAEHSDRPYLLLVAMAMMVGATGLRLVIKGVTGGKP